VKGLAPFGRLAVYGTASGEPASFYPENLMRRNQSDIGILLPQMMINHELFKASLQEHLTYGNKAEPALTISATYASDEAAQVHRLLQGRKTQGKIVLIP